MSIRSIFTNDISSEGLRAAILRTDVQRAREIRKWRCGVCGTVHAGAGPQVLCPVCKRPASRCNIVT